MQRCCRVPPLAPPWSAQVMYSQPKSKKVNSRSTQKSSQTKTTSVNKVKFTKKCPKGERSPDKKRKSVKKVTNYMFQKEDVNVVKKNRYLKN